MLLQTPARSLIDPSSKFRLENSQLPWLNGWRLPLLSRWLCNADTTPSAEFNRIFIFSYIIPMFWSLKTYLNKVVTTCRQSKPQLRPFNIPVLPHHLNCCELLPKSKCIKKYFVRSLFQKNSPAEKKNERRYYKPQRVISIIVSFAARDMISSSSL